jgi:hypothetical protein
MSIQPRKVIWSVYRKSDGRLDGCGPFSLMKAAYGAVPGLNVCVRRASGHGLIVKDLVTGLQLDQREAREELAFIKGPLPEYPAVA